MTKSKQKREFRGLDSMMEEMVNSSLSISTPQLSTSAPAEEGRNPLLKNRSYSVRSPKGQTRESKSHSISSTQNPMGIQDSTPPTTISKTASGNRLSRVLQQHKLDAEIRDMEKILYSSMGNSSSTSTQPEVLTYDLDLSTKEIKALKKMGKKERPEKKASSASSFLTLRKGVAAKGGGNQPQ